MPSSSAAPRAATLPLDPWTLRHLFPGCPPLRIPVYLEPFNAACLEYSIDTDSRIAAFAAQLGHESIDLTAWEERASGAAYDTGRLATLLGNTPARDHDGERYKGRGPIQLTGRANYQAAGEAIGEDLVAHPELAADPHHGFKIAAWFWATHGCNELADRGAFLTISKRINGGYNGLADRQDRWARAKRVLAERWADLAR